MKTTEFRNPETLEDWQEAVDLAHTCLCLDSARVYGLVTGGPEVNIERCLELLSLAVEHGIEPREDAVSRVMPALMRESMS